jgi:hypothetical protein
MIINNVNLFKILKTKIKIEKKRNFYAVSVFKLQTLERKYAQSF